MKTKEILRGARERIARGWCQGAFARNAHGAKTYATSADAVSWSAYGAIAAAEPDPDERLGAVVWFFSAAPDAMSMFDWNNCEDRTQDDVLAVFDKAIERCEK